jgi:hypothetical protein
MKWVDDFLPRDPHDRAALSSSSTTTVKIFSALALLPFVIFFAAGLFSDQFEPQEWFVTTKGKATHAYARTARISCSCVVLIDRRASLSFSQMNGTCRFI